MIKSLQIGRDLAALAVAVYHTYLILDQKTGTRCSPTWRAYGYDGFGRSLVEALSCGTLTIAHELPVSYRLLDSSDAAYTDAFAKSCNSMFPQPNAVISSPRIAHDKMPRMS